MGRREPVADFDHHVPLDTDHKTTTEDHDAGIHQREHEPEQEEDDALDEDMDEDEDEEENPLLPIFSAAYLGNS